MRGVAFLLGLAVLTASGCAPILVGAGAGAAGYQFHEGRLEYAVNANVERTRKAVEAEIQNRHWEITQQTRDATSASFRCEKADRTQIYIDVTRRSHDFTRVAILIGTWGDEAQSRAFIEEVKKRL